MQQMPAAIVCHCSSCPGESTCTLPDIALAPPHIKTTTVSTQLIFSVASRVVSACSRAIPRAKYLPHAKYVPFSVSAARPTLWLSSRGCASTIFSAARSHSVRKTHLTEDKDDAMQKGKHKELFREKKTRSELPSGRIILKDATTLAELLKLLEPFEDGKSVKLQPGVRAFRGIEAAMALNHLHRLRDDPLKDAAQQ
jgi:hypothetical protein